MTSPGRETEPTRADQRSQPQDQRSVDALDEAVEDAVGHEVDEEVSRRALERPAPGVVSTLAASKLLVGITLAIAVVVGVMLSLWLDSWWFVVLATAVHVVVTLAVVTMTLRVTTQVEKPDPGTVASLEEAGVPDPEQKVNEAIRAAEGESGKSPVRQVLEEDAGRTQEPTADPAEATTRQQKASTPASEHTETA